MGGEGTHCQLVPETGHPLAAAAQAGGGTNTRHGLFLRAPYSRLSTGMALLLPSFSLLLVRFLHSESRNGSAYFPTPDIHPCVPRLSPGARPIYLVSPLPRGVSIPGASGALLSPSRAAAPDCPNAILESLALAESCVWTSRAAAPKPRGGEAGRSAGRFPGTPGTPPQPWDLRARAPQQRCGCGWLSGVPRPGLREVGDQRHGGELRARALRMHRRPPGRLSARPAGEGEPGSTARVAREGGDVSVAGWDTGRAEVTSGLGARAMAAAVAAARVAA